MSKINVSTITNRTGTSGPVLSGVTTTAVTHANGAVTKALKLTTNGSYSYGNSQDAGPSISFGQFNDNYPTWITSQVAGIREGGNWNGALTFWTNNGTSETDISEKLRIHDNGDIGINTSGGTYTVQMHEPSAGSFTLQLTTGAIGSASTSGVRLTASSSRKFYIENQENEDTLFYNNGGEKLVIKSGGNVNITNGDLVVANGHGIDFSATGHATGMTNDF